MKPIQNRSRKLLAGVLLPIWPVLACSSANVSTSSEMETSDAALRPAARPTGSKVPGRVEAENYDTGGEGVGYFTGRANWGTANPRRDSMDIGSDAAASGGYFIGWTASGQWFRYTITGASAGSYTLGFVVSTSWNSSVHVTIDGVDVTGSVALSPLNGSAYHTVSSKPFNLTSGTHAMKVYFEGSTPALDAIDLKAATAVPPPITPPVTPSQTVTLHGHTYTFNPAMSDEFNGSALDTKKWLAPYKGGVQRLNDEWECYTDNGTRQMTASSLKLLGEKTGPNHTAADCGSPNYQSGLIRSSSQQKFGYFEASMKMPAGAGMWPAFWLIAGPNAANNNAPTWPPEIDIMEMVNNGREGPYQVTQFLHGCGSALDATLVNSWGDYPIQYGATNFADGKYHQFAAEWTPTQLIAYVDGSIARTYNFNWDMKGPAGNQGLADPATCTTYDNGPAEVIVNLAMGGSWPGDIDDSVLPQALELDYVRIYSY